MNAQVEEGSRARPGAPRRTARIRSAPSWARASPPPGNRWLRNPSQPGATD